MLGCLVNRNSKRFGRSTPTPHAVFHPNRRPMTRCRRLRHVLAKQEVGIEEESDARRHGLSERTQLDRPREHVTGKRVALRVHAAILPRHWPRTGWDRSRYAAEPGRTAPSPSTNPWEKTCAPAARRLGRRRGLRWADCVESVASFASAAGCGILLPAVVSRQDKDESKQEPAAGVSCTLRNEICWFGREGLD